MISARVENCSQLFIRYQSLEGPLFSGVETIMSSVRADAVPHRIDNDLSATAEKDDRNTDNNLMNFCK